MDFDSKQGAKYIYWKSIFVADKPKLKFAYYNETRSNYKYYK